MFFGNRKVGQGAAVAAALVAAAAVAGCGNNECITTDTRGMATAHRLHAVNVTAPGTGTGTVTVAGTSTRTSPCGSSLAPWNAGLGPYSLNQGDYGQLLESGVCTEMGQFTKPVSILGETIYGWVRQPGLACPPPSVPVCGAAP